jgi:hypothetical protein
LPISSTDPNDKPDKEQPWKKLFPPQAPATTSSNTPGGSKDAQATESQTAPWKGWKPNPDAPDDKPWYQWMNDSSTNPGLGKKKQVDLAGEEEATTEPVNSPDEEEGKTEPANPSEEGRGREKDPEKEPARKRSSSQGTVAEGG